ncbi:Z-ring formation inhibitor MciZ [Brevibacillus sp. B_LB10_24]|uniref:Z-ring formation inhibitor MciZ n=1 Tax=Brevibacillus sp. B_LB10_24 TaxID=3380645 RepID=UPI0038B902C9
MLTTSQACPKQIKRELTTMKTYSSLRHLRIVGKAWEIRAKLRGWAGNPMTLQEWLGRLDRAAKR